MRSTLYYCFAIILLVSACANNALQYEHTEEDKKLAAALLGNWVWKTEIDDCHEDGEIKFRRSGKYTRTSEDCLMASDSFNIFHYGWYVADQHICFVGTETQHQQLRKAGYSEDHCHWEVVEYSSRQIKIMQEFGSNHEFVLRRK